MRDLDPHTPEPPREDILLAEVNGGFWLLEGEAHLDAMLANVPGYPTPVGCLRFESDFDLRLFLSARGLAPGALWGIHPAIVARLRRKDELATIDPAAALGEG